MSNKIKFTAGRVDCFACEAGKPFSIFWDTDVKGFGVKANQGGSRVYIFQDKLARDVVRITIGSTNTQSLSEARIEANRLKLLFDKGVDPRELAKEQQERLLARKAELKGKELLVGEVWGEYLDYQKDKMTRPHIERGKKWGARHLKDHENLSQAGGGKKKRGSGETKQGVLYPLMSERMADITAELLSSWQKREAEVRANNARQGFEMFRAFWRWCSTRPEYAKVIDLGAVENKELRDEVPSRKSKKFDVLQRGHLKAWFKAATSLNSHVARVYLQALLLTGARREEMANLRWADVDFQWSALWVKDKVDAEGRKIPLTPYLRCLIDQLPRRNEWVFSSPTAKDGRYKDPSVAHQRVLKLAEIPPVTIHGLKRSFLSLVEWTEMPKGICSQIVGHSESATAEKHYVTRPLDLLAIWHAKYEAWILEQAEIEFKPSEGRQTLKVVGAQ
ncbi:integrase [Polynucleobacter sphagniphilus]|uniref:tyrosine-type recombinase/integrase n=1 Tax=Polynucleobacter sphagniphilus TaxID=1743169 RepID=UPI0024743628|nr:integrase family protein [Polynucleobacter sphagniphilus]MDH6301746.1 integrase [Polynucleobacter sphagniphilus]